MYTVLHTHTCTHIHATHTCTHIHATHTHIHTLIHSHTLMQTHTHMYTHTCHTHTHTHTCTHSYTYTHTCKHIHTHTPIPHTHPHTHAHTHAHTHTHSYTHTHTYIHTHTLTYMQTHTHTHTSNASEHFPRHAAKSFDIQASPTLSRRPPLKNNANMFEIVEERKLVTYAPSLILMANLDMSGERDKAIISFPIHLYYKISDVCVCVCWTDVTSPRLHRAYSCGTVSPACKVSRALAREERETRRRANADAMREARARESREEGETRWRANADAIGEARARESREEGETRRRANTDALREARARRIADRGWSHICPLAFRRYCCSRPNAHTKVVEASEATCNIHVGLVSYPRFISCYCLGLFLLVLLYICYLHCVCKTN